MQLVTIETKRLLLKGISFSAMQFIFENHSKEEIKKILGHQTEAAYEEELAKHRNGYSSYNRRFLLFLLTDSSTEKIIGRCGLHNWNEEHRRAEIGYVMTDESFRQKGLMSEAVEAIITYGFTKLLLQRIEALVGHNNTPSLSIMKKFNFFQEGILRNHFFVDNQFEDSIQFSKLYSEYLQEQNVH